MQNCHTMSAFEHVHQVYITVCSIFENQTFVPNINTEQDVVL